MLSFHGVIQNSNLEETNKPKKMLRIILVVGLVVSVQSECWWTGCQLDSWAVKGCDQYNMDTRATERCAGGTKYQCCDRETGGGGGGGGGNMPTYQEFSNAVTNNGYPAPSQNVYNNFIANADRGKISSKDETAMALAQFLHESDGLRAKREYACAQTNCPNEYRSPGCDYPGQYYYGRGYIQLSWCEWNYKPASYDLFGDDRLVRNPDLVAQDESTAWSTAFWFWGKNVHDKQGVQQGQFGATTNAINGNLECRGQNTNIARKRYAIYGQVRRGFNLAGPGDERGCY